MAVTAGREALELDRGGGIALWRQIAERLERDIAAGRYAPGQQLPTEFALAAAFGVNRHTLRRALATLQDRGLVGVAQGRGSFVPSRTVEYAIGRRTRFQENILKLGRAPGGEILRAETVAAPKPVAAELALRPGTSVHLVERLGRVDGAPVSLALHYFPAARFPGLIGAFAGSASITVALAAAGIDDYVRRTTRIGARLPGSRERRLLELPRHGPVLVTESTNADLEGRLIEYGLCLFAADRVQLTVGAGG